MKKYHFLCALFSALTLCAAPSAGQVFKNTTRHIDFDGDSLFYYNTTELFSLLQNLPASIVNTGKAANLPPQKLQQCKNYTELLIRTLNLSSLQAVAVSRKSLPGGLYLSKGFLYLGQNGTMPGIFNRTGITNTLKLDEVLCEFPADLIAGAKFQFNASAFYASAEQGVNASKSDELKMQYSLIKTLLTAQGVDPAKVFAAASGNYTMFAAGTSPENFRAKVIIPDNDGSVAAALKIFFPPSAAAPDRALLPTSDKNIQPALLFLDKKIVLTSNLKAEPAIKRPLTIPAQFSRHFPLPASGIAVMNISPQLLASLRSGKFGDPRLAEILKNVLAPVKPMSAVEISREERDGIRTTMVSNFTATGLYYLLNNELTKLATMK